MNEIMWRDWLWATWDYLVQGGWIMVPMVAASLLMWALILGRLRTYRRLGGQDIESVDAIQAVTADEAVNPGGGLRRTLVRHFQQARIGRPAADEFVLQHTTERMRRALRRRLAVIAVLAGVAPLLGLLGTVLGMIQTFEVIAIFGTSNAKAMAGGISVALITTQTGLLIAIPGLFISGSLARRASRLESVLDEFSSALRRALREQNNGADNDPDRPGPQAMEAVAT